MLVKEIMTAKMESITPEHSLRDAARRMRDLRIGSLPVIENGRLIGFVTDRDICCRAVAESLDTVKTPVRDVMSHEVAFCFSDDNITEAAHRMEGMHVRRLAVLNHDKSIAGFLSVDDLAHYSHHLAGEVIDAAQPLH